MNMFIQFSDQAWAAYSKDAEENGVISQYVNYLIEKIRNDDSWLASIGERGSRAGDVSIKYEITKDRIIIKTIVW